MAANLIRLNQGTDFGRTVVRALQLIREGVETLEHSRARYLQARDGDGSQDADYDLIATEGGFQAGDYADANAAAHASFLEIDSLFSKVGTDGNVSNVRSAILQACAKHGT